MSAARAYHAGTSSRDYGNPTGVQTVDKGAAGYLIPSSGPAYGYFSGGKSPSYPTVTQIQRVDYASDTSTASPKGNLSITEQSNAGGTGNLTHGYSLG